MKKSELKNIIKECVKEVIFEEGVLSGIITEVAQGLTAQPLLENIKPSRKIPQADTDLVRSRIREELISSAPGPSYEEAKKRFSNPALFEGTSPLPADQGQGALSNVSPHDPGVDITQLPGMNSWASVARGKK